jgi:hypothetical protein
MQAQTTGKRYGGSRKVMGGLLIAASLVAGAAGFAFVGDLEIPGIGSDASPARPAVFDTHVGPKHGEGLTLSAEQPVIEVGTDTAPVRVREPDAPQGEGFPMIEPEPADHQQFLPQGEGLPMGGR